MPKSCYFIFFGTLNDFLPHSVYGMKRKYSFFGNPSIMDAIEAQGIPHTEIGLILINNAPNNSNSKIQAGDQIEVYPNREYIKNDSKIEFIVDSHLGKLAKNLRILGFDCLYDTNYIENRICEIAEQENRVVLTRNVGLLKNKRILHGYWLRSQEPSKQLQEVIDNLKLKDKIKPFFRCRLCNGLINKISKLTIEDQLLPMTKAHFNEFFQCEECNRIYWKGSHYEKLMKLIESTLKA
ncbi:MAG TPA: Mut7-C RNAse domain-containing protein [Anditalea sp.]|nr:Mut7-C RNAse domain-containing protein [Anditalea sp.]